MIFMLNKLFLFICSFIFFIPVQIALGPLSLKITVFLILVLSILAAITILSSKKIKAEILSADESYGLSGHYFDERGKYIAGNLITTFLGAFSEGFKSKVIAEFGGGLAQYTTGNFKNALLNALEKTAFSEAKRQAERLQEVKPFVVVPRGVPGVLMVSG